MATNEEYLDNLLKSLEETPATPDTSNNDIQGNDIIDVLDQTEEKKIVREAEEENSEEDWKTSLDELLAAADSEEFQMHENEAEQETEESVADKQNTEEKTVSEEQIDFENMDVTQLIDHMDHADDDLAEINGLLKKSDNNEAVEDDMPSFPDGIKDENSEGGSSDTAADQTEENTGKNLKAEKKEAKKRKRMEKKEKRRLGQKKTASMDSDLINSDSMEAELTDAVPQAGEEAEQENDVRFSDQNGEIEEIDLSENIDIVEKNQEKEKRGKAPGFLARIFQMLTQEEEEPQPEVKLDENGEILKELEQEDQANARKKKKKEKKKGKNKEVKKNKGDSEEGEEGEEQEKEKKKKKEKVKKEKPAKNDEKTVKVLTKTTLLLMIAFCATLITAIVCFSLFLPDFSDKKNARNAFYQGDYETSYELLYDKDLNESDQIIFQRAKIVLQLERRIASYENYKNLGKELEALDALLQGIGKYDALIGEAQSYGAEGEVEALYQKILTSLSESYDIREEDAKEINSYDDAAYTKKLNSVVFGTEFVKPGEEVEEPLPPQDILPEEEEIITL